MTSADSLIEVNDLNEKLCKIPYRNIIDDEESAFFEKVQITQSYLSPVYQVKKIDTTGIYFVAEDPETRRRNKRKGYNVNYDYVYGERIPRFRLYDKRRESNRAASCFMKIDNSAFKRITIQGLMLSGNTGRSPLIYVNRVSASEFEIEKCTFEYIRGKVAIFSEANNIIFNKHNIRNTAGNEISFTKGCYNIRVTNNHFNNCGHYCPVKFYQSESWRLSSGF